MGKNPDFDFIGIGDMVVDAFIRLKEAHINCVLDHEKCQICMRFGDKIPYEDVYRVPAVGNSANAAISAARLGLKSALITNVGDDYYGALCIGVLKDEKVSADFVRINKGMKTNYHYVLWYADDRTILVKHEKFNYSFPKIGKPKWFYLSSMGADSLPFHKVIENYLKENPEVKLSFQPGTFQIRVGAQELKYFYERAEVFFCNKDEAQRILKTTEEDVKKLMSDIGKLGPKIVVITDGKKGAYAFDGKESFFMPSYPDPKPPYERTGAGDAFSSTFVVALILGKDFKEALRWAPINSMSVVQHVGAREGLLTRKKLEDYLKKAPEDYKPRLL